MPEPASTALEPRSFRILLDDAVRWTRRYLGRLFPWIALPLTTGLVALSAFQMVWMSSILSLAEDPDIVRLIGGYCAFLAAALAIGLLFGLTAVVTVVCAVDAVAGRPVSVARGWRFLLEWRVLATCLLSGLLVMAGFAFFLLPGIYALLALGFVTPVMVEEGARLGDAMGRSFRLTHHNPQGWLRSPLVKLLVACVVAYLIQTLFNLIFQVPFTAAQQLLTIRDAVAGGDGPEALRGMLRWGWLQIPAAFFNGLTSALVLLYSAFITALLYADSRRRQEGWDLERALDALERSRSPWHPSSAREAGAEGPA